MDRTDLPIEAAKINGEYIEDILEGYTTVITSGREGLQAELSTYTVGASDGERVKSSKFPARTIEVEFVLQGNSMDDLRSKLTKLNNILSVDESDVVFNDESDKYYTGYTLIDNSSFSDYKNATRGKWTLYCAYPFKRSVETFTLASTDATGVVLDESSATFTFNYSGSYPARPLLRASFAAPKQNGDYNEDGDCGFVAFLDPNENIIQLGNPDVIDVDQYAKNGTIANSEFSALTAWTPTNVAVGQITDTYWNKGKGQTQKYAKPTGTASLTRATAGATDHEFDIVHRLCVNKAAQTGKFEALAMNNGTIIVGVRIQKTGNGTTGKVSYILNGKVVGTDNIDLSYYNTNFGYCKRTAVYTNQTYYVTVTKKVKGKKKKVKEKRTRKVLSKYKYTQSNLNTGWSKEGGVVTFSVGRLADRTFKDSEIENTAIIDVVFNFTGNLHTNALHSCSVIAKAGVPFAEIPNVFTAGDVVEADCNDANVTLFRSGSLDGHLEPQYGALGNDWEDFVIRPGENTIRAVWSDWVNTDYKPTIEIEYNEVFL